MEGESSNGRGESSTAGRGLQEPEKQDFWDNFGAGRTGEGSLKKGSAIGTAAMKGGGVTSGTGGEGRAKDDGWEEW